MSIIKQITFADTLTLVNALCGILAIFSAIQKEFTLSAVFILCAVLFDYLDGKIARLTNSIHDFGKELDSLSDIISFGVAPSVFAFSFLIKEISQAYLIALTFILVFFVLAGCLRLARFNTQKDTSYFIGVPITTNGVLFPILYFVKFPSSYLPFVFLVMGFLMISSFKLKKVIK